MQPITSAIFPNFSASARETTAYDCALVELPRITNRAGNITALQPGQNCPFPVRRVYYLYDVPGGASRGGHAHLELQQLIIAVSGSFDVLVDDGCNRRTITLNRPYYALHLVPGIWRELHNFSSGGNCLVLASLIYDPADYVRDYAVFKTMKLSRS